MMMFRSFLWLTCNVLVAWALSPKETAVVVSRRAAIGWMAGAGGWALTTTTTTTTTGGHPSHQTAWADNELPDRFNVEDFLRTGVVANPMGVSGQAGKSRPETGVLLVDGSDISQDPRTGSVLAEILVSDGSKKVPVLTTYTAPWPLATGQQFDVECRDPNTGDGAFLAVSSSTGGKSIAELQDSFFLKDLTGPTGRFSSYGEPTDIRVRKSTLKDGGKYRVLDISFSTLSQSTQTEIPRRARVVATIPEGTDQAVMLVGSASALRWKRGAEGTIASVMDSFRAVPAPQSSLRLRAKERRNS